MVFSHNSELLGEGRSKDPPQFVVLMKDIAAMIGILIALAGTWATIHWSDARIDGMASIAIELLLAGVSILLAKESKALLIGERADAALRKWRRS
jgi:divalent metal cation (Fe/Co/Zn/Cd) transporter